MVCTSITIAPIKPVISALSVVQVPVTGTYPNVNISWTQSIAGRIQVIVGSFTEFDQIYTAGPHTVTIIAVAAGTWNICVIAP